MATSERAFQQVKAILSKLDRSIDEARERRLHGSAPAPAPSPGPVNPAPGATLGPDGRPIGRARPIPTDRGRQDPNASSGALERWSR